MVERCKWCQDDPLLIAYHDHEWGRETHDDQLLFEYLTLELFQSGLSWRTVLHKREAMREAFAGFDFNKVKAFDQKKVEALMQHPGIIKNRRKIEATIKNAGVVAELVKKHGSFDRFLETLPADVEEKKKALSKVFYHVGPTVAESFFQAAGIIPVIHDETCFLLKK
ncbi:DNA-3-methyladenine glycosylase I [Tuberibacillus calidus]|jgi:DNA-3-methyladenine glycosylase I|uniref:DNA-3-methyladenine glycosylase I n=1 Tax=Tuberibacillus calidus TaxID=340097 RepID=UPI0003FFB341|nr:DNA-3-methyladenine glycosylase I [Tuberibacillus calidus]